MKHPIANLPAFELPRYRSHKTVWALKIKEVIQSPADKVVEGGSYELVPEDQRYPFITVPAAFVAKHDPQPGGYFVVYKDGYQSFCPAEAFEEGNEPADSEEHPHAKSADLRSFTQAELSNWFSYHAPTPEQLVQYGEIRTAAKVFAEVINRHVPAGADKTAAMRKLRDTVMAANAAIACHVAPEQNI